MTDPTFNPRRLTIARKRRGLTKRALAAGAGLGDRIITAYETEERDPPRRTLEELARILNFPVSFFYCDDLDVPDVTSASFRAVANMTSAQRDAALGAGALAIEVSRWIEARFQLPPVELPDLAGLDPETAAESLRSEWGLGERPIRNMIHLMEAHGVRVFSLVEENKSVDAFSLWLGNVPFVFLNTQKSGERSRMDAAHELGHLVMHRYGIDKRRSEDEANHFGGAFLMPRSSIMASGRGLLSVEHLIKLKKPWGSSIAALAYRLHAVGGISDWTYRKLFIQISQAGYRLNEPNSIAHETSQVLHKVFSALRKEGTGVDQISCDLHLNPEEIASLVFGLVMMPVRGGSKPGGGNSTPGTLRLLDSGQSE